MSRYKVLFDFTTAHNNGRIVGRNGQLYVETDYKIDEINKKREDVESLCCQFIHSEKPRWNILLLTVKEILPA